MPVVKVKMKYEDEIRRVAGGVRAEADTPWLVVYGSNDKPVARFELDQVRDWWPEDSSSNSRQESIDAAVRKIEAALKPDVVRIRYSIGTDWSDDPAVYFRVILTDEAAEHRLHTTASSVRESLDSLLDFSARGLRAYHHFRSESEQSALKEKAWD